jgi:hypothetical protein
VEGIMKILITTVCILLANGSLGFCQNNTVSDSSVQNSQEEEKNADLYLWEFGNVKEGEIVEHDFVFTNDSQTALLIKEISSTCGCTVPKVEKKNLGPGESTSIKVKFNSAKYRGLIKQFVYINTDSVDNPIIRLTVTAQVQ